MTIAIEEFTERRPYNAVTDFVDANIARRVGDKPAFTDGTNRSWRMKERLGPLPSKLREAPSASVLDASTPKLRLTMLQGGSLSW